MEFSRKFSGERCGFAGRSTRGASLVTTVIALVFAGFAMVILGWYISSESAWFRTMTTTTQEDAYATYQKEIIVEGFDPSLGTNALTGVALETPDSSDLFTINNNGALQVDHLGSDPFADFHHDAVGGGGFDGEIDDSPDIVYGELDPLETGGGIGSMLLPSGYDPTFGMIKLEPPIVVTSGYVPITDFPVSGWLAPNPANPVDTVYRYSFNGVPVTVDSPEYSDGVIISLASLPTEIQVMATHPQTDVYLPSDIVSFIIQTGVKVLYARADGSQETTFTFYEATGALTDEGIVLTMDPDVEGTIHYTLDGTDPNSSSDTAPAFMLPSLAAWASGSGNIELRAIANPSDIRYLPESILSVDLAAIPVELETPELGVTAGQTIGDGDLISSAHENPYAAVQLKIEDLFWAEQTGNAWFTISLPEVEYP